MPNRITTWQPKHQQHVSDTIILSISEECLHTLIVTYTEFLTFKLRTLLWKGDWGVRNGAAAEIRVVSVTSLLAWAVTISANVNKLAASVGYDLVALQTLLTSSNFRFWSHFYFRFSYNFRCDTHFSALPCA